MTAAAIIIALAIVAVLVFVLRARGDRDRSPREPSQTTPEKFDTTLGDLHDMREALRPLEHTRAASRRDPQQRQ